MTRFFIERTETICVSTHYERLDVIALLNAWSPDHHLDELRKMNDDELLHALTSAVSSDPDVEKWVLNHNHIRRNADLIDKTDWCGSIVS